MKRHDLERFHRLASPVHQRPAWVKVGCALAVVGVTALLPRFAWAAYAGVAALVLGLAALSRVPAGYLLKRLLTLEPLVLGMALMALFQPGGGMLFLAVLTKSTLCLLTVILLAATTPFSEMLGVFRRAGVPTVFLDTLALMYRYIFVLADETERMRRARLSRTFNRRRTHLWRSLATVAGQLFIRASERAERIYDAMCARGWAQGDRRRP